MLGVGRRSSPEPGGPRYFRVKCSGWNRSASNTPPVTAVPSQTRLQCVTASVDSDT